MKFRTATIIIVLASVVLILLSQRHVTRIPGELMVGDYVGVNLDRDQLHFGTIVPGTGASRGILLTSEKRMQFRIEVDGFNGMVYPEEAEFILEPNQQKEVNLVAAVPENAAKGPYHGTIMVYWVKA